MALTGSCTASALTQRPPCCLYSAFSSPSRGSCAWRPATKLAAADLRQQLVTSALQDPSLVGLRAAVSQTSSLLVTSKDWQQLQSVFVAAASQPAPSVPDPLQQVPLPTQRSAGGSSPWGFALRQPARTQPAASSSIPQLQQQACQWDWGSVQALTVLGLGSMQALLVQGNAQPQNTPSSRLGFRLMQLSLAVALQQHMLPGLTSRPTAYDPEFERADIELLDSLGFTVPACEPNHMVTAPTLLYMPCCPRQLYSDVLAANLPHLHQLAILGTSMSSLSNTQSLFSALVGESQGTEGSSTPATEQPRRQQETDMVTLAFQKGLVVELPCPDCSAHGVGVSLHMCKQQS